MSKQKNVVDAALHREKYLPAAAATNYTDSIDLGQINGGAEPNDFELRVKVEAAPNNTDNTKTILLTLQHSADDSTYTDVGAEQDQAGQIVSIPGVTSTGSVAVNARLRVSSNIGRYIRLKQVVPSGGGDNTAVLVELDPCF